MSATPIHDAEFLTIWWDDSTRIIGIDWKGTTAGMSDEQFKMELTLFACYVEKQKARGILWRRILMLVWRDERSAGDIARDFSISRPAVSQHLGVLRASKLVTLRRAGTRCLYRTNHAAIAKLRAELGAFWDDRLSALKGRLEAAERSRRRP